MRVKPTDAICSQKPPKEDYLELWDLLMPGLCLRIYPSGARTFSCMPRDADGIQRRVSFKPRYPLLSLKDARDKVRESSCSASTARRCRRRPRRRAPLLGRSSRTGSAASWRPRRRRSERTLKRVSGRRSSRSSLCLTTVSARLRSSR